MSVQEIPDLHISQLQENASVFLIMPVEDWLKHYQHVITAPHRTSYYQLLLIQDGNGVFEVDSLKYSYTPETLITVSKGRTVSFDFDSETRGYAVLFTDDFLCLYPEDISWLNSLALFNNSAGSYSNVPSERDYLDLLIQMRHIEKEFFTSEDFAKNELLINMVRNFLLMSERTRRTEIRIEGTEIKELNCVFEFRKLLEYNFKRHRSVQFYADLLHITGKQLNQVTLRFMGKSVKSVIDERVQLAAKSRQQHINRAEEEIEGSHELGGPGFYNKFSGKSPLIPPVENSNKIKGSLPYSQTRHSSAKTPRVEAIQQA